MDTLLIRAGIPALVCLWSVCAQAATPNVELSWFTELPAMSGVTLSPDGRHIAYIGRRGETPVVLTRDLADPDAPAHMVITNSTGDTASINWCRWANNERLLCSVQMSYGTLKSVAKRSVNDSLRTQAGGYASNPYSVYGSTNYSYGLGIGAWNYPNSYALDGTGAWNYQNPYGFGGNQRSTSSGRQNGLSYAIKANTFETRLVSASINGDELVEMGQKNTGKALVQDKVIDWNPGEANSILMTLDDNLDGYPSVEKLDVITGKLSTVYDPLKGVTRYFTDSRGQVRLAQGKSDHSFFYLARLNGEEKWRLVAAYRLDSMRDALKPDSVEAGTNRVLAFGSVDGRRTLFEADLSKPKAKPKILASHPSRDILNALYATDGRYIGYSYIDEQMHYVYTDAKARKAWEIAAQQLPKDISLRIADVTRDNAVYLFEASSDVDAGSYYALDTRKADNSLKFIGSARPELEGLPLPRMETISYKAADGSEIQGFLTRPLNGPAKNLPVVVMPHGFTSGVDLKQFDYLRLFLASRGHAVLQMNFRGSWGYGQKWLAAGQGNWGSVAHSDIVDGARWAIAQGIADPNRLAIAGFNWGGYQALLGGYRNDGLFKAVISIGGITNLIEGKDAMDATSEALVGDKRKQLRRDSPVYHAEDMTAPVLLIHGGLDMLADPYHSERMAGFLKGEHKAYTYVAIKEADNRFWQPSERNEILTSVEAFLAQHLSPETGLPNASAMALP